MKLEHLLIGMVINKDIIFFVGHPAMLASEVIKRQITIKSALGLPRVKVGVP